MGVRPVILICITGLLWRQSLGFYGDTGSCSGGPTVLFMLSAQPCKIVLCLDKNNT